MAVFQFFKSYIFLTHSFPESLGKWCHLWLGKWKPAQKNFERFFQKYFFKVSKYTFLT